MSGKSEFIETSLPIYLPADRLQPLHGRLSKVTKPVCSLMWLATVVTALILLTGNSAAAAWKAGVAKECITPPQPMWMAGYASRDHASEGTLHDLWAKALVLQDQDGQRLVLVSLDVVGIGRKLSVEVCNTLQKNHQLDRSRIALCTSHTHTGPVVGRNLRSMYFFDDAQQKLVSEYADLLVERINAAVTAAIQNVEPVAVSFGMGTATFAVNRRNNREADVPKLRKDEQLKGPVDHSTPVLAVRNKGGDLTAVVFGYACHATVLSSYQWSGDWPGFAQIEIEKRHPETVALFVAGCGADQNPLPRRTVELAEGYGRQMADAVDEVLSGDMSPVDGETRAAYSEIPLKLAELPTQEQIEKDTKSENRYIASRAKGLLKKLKADGKLNSTYPDYPVQVWAIGSEARLVFLGGEVVVDYSNRLRSEFADRSLWVAGYTNDVMAYIPSKRVLMEGGYEGASSMIYYALPTVWAPSIEEDIAETVHKLVQRVDDGSK